MTRFPVCVNRTVGTQKNHNEDHKCAADGHTGDFQACDFQKKFAHFVVLWDTVSFGLMEWNLARAAREIQENQLECGPIRRSVESWSADRGDSPMILQAVEDRNEKGKMLILPPGLRNISRALNPSLVESDRNGMRPRNWGLEIGI